MFGVDGTFATHVSFLYGCSAGDSQGELQKFHAWLNKDSETSSNMSWVWLVLKKAFPGQGALWDPGAPRTAEEEDIAVVALLDSLEEFIDSGEGKRSALTDNEERTQAAEVVAAEWKTVLDSSDGLIDPAMPRAAYANPRLRELFPVVSHGALYLSRCIRPPRMHDVGTLFPRGGGGFVVIRQSDGTTLGEPGTVEEAIGLIVANLPEGCGPAIDGTADDL